MRKLAVLIVVALCGAAAWWPLLHDPQPPCRLHSIGVEGQPGQPVLVVSLSFASAPRCPERFSMSLRSGLWRGSERLFFSWDEVAPDPAMQTPAVGETLRLVLPLVPHLDFEFLESKRQNMGTEASLWLVWGGHHVLSERVELAPLLAQLDDGCHATVRARLIGDQAIETRIRLGAAPEAPRELRLNVGGTALLENLQIGWEDLARANGLDPESDPPLGRDLTYRIDISLKESFATPARGTGARVRLHWGDRYRAHATVDMSHLYTFD